MNFDQGSSYLLLILLIKVPKYGYGNLNSDDRVTVDEEVSNSDDIQGSATGKFVPTNSSQQGRQQQITLFSSRVCDKPLMSFDWQSFIVMKRSQNSVTLI